VGRICVLCYKHTKRNLPFCYEHYQEFQEVIDEAIKTNAEWLSELERITQAEYRRQKKYKKDLSLSIIGEEVFDE